MKPLILALCLLLCCAVVPALGESAPDTKEARAAADEKDALKTAEIPRQRELAWEEYRQAMAGIYSTSVSEGTLDESPMAYKSLSDIVDVIGDTVDIIDIMKPVYNFKAAEDETPPWKKDKA